jgi:hypothetical protein
MQMLLPTDKNPGAYNATTLWTDALSAEGATQMQYLKTLMLSRPFLERVPDNTLVANQGEKYSHIQATRGEAYAFLYTYMGGIKGSDVNVSWFNPRSGEVVAVGRVKNEGIATFITPAPAPKEGNDWVLVLDGV